MLGNVVRVLGALLGPPNGHRRRGLDSLVVDILNDDEDNGTNIFGLRETSKRGGRSPNADEGPSLTLL
jgi:hypothetical protein